MAIREEQTRALVACDVALRTLEALREPRVDDETAVRELDCRSDDRLQRERAVLAKRLFHSCDGAGNAHREMARDAFVREVAVRVEIHVARRGERRDLAV